jgi:RNA polymerase sigma-70 factor (ECF subfamily)
MTFEHQLSYIKSYLLTFTNDYYLIDELSQLVNIKAFTNKPKTDNENQYKVWLKKTTKFVYIDYYRQIKTQKAGRLVYEEHDGYSQYEPDGDIITQETNTFLTKCIETLPEKQKEIIYLRYYCKLSYLEICKLMNCPKNTALGYMYDAKRKLKILITKNQQL